MATVRIGTVQVVVPTLRGAVGPAQASPVLNDQADLALVDGHLEKVAGLAAVSNLPRGTAVTATQASTAGTPITPAHRLFRARRMVNGTNHANDIADIARIFEAS